MGADIVTKGNGYCEKFLGFVTAGIQGLQAAGLVLIEWEEKTGDARRTLIEEHGFTPASVTAFELFGRGMLLPEIWIKAPRLRLLPVAEQRRIVDDGVDAIVLKPDGSTDVQKVDLLKAPTAMRRQLLGGSHVRSLAEQKCWLVANANRDASRKPVDGMPWRVEGKHVHVLKESKFSRGDLLSMMKALE
jgi:hypothetical protein